MTAHDWHVAIILIIFAAYALWPTPRREARGNP